jgi:replicative DNA helicase
MEKISSLHGLAEACPAPMHRWFHDQRHKVLALALDAIERGEIPHDQGAVMDYLSRIRWQDALDALKGKPLVLCASTDLGETALVGIQAAALLSDAATSRAGSGLVYGPPARVAQMLRHLADRLAVLTQLSHTITTLAKVGITEDASPILNGLSDLLRRSSTTTGERSVGDALGQAIATAERDAADRAAGTSRPASWGLPSLDAALPLRAGRLYVLSARPGGGKTSLGLQAAHATSRALGRRSVAYLSLEMAADELALVLACRDAQVPRRKAAEAWETLLEADRQELKGLARVWESDGCMWLRDASAGPQTVANVAAWIRGQRSRHGALELVVVDYLGLIKGSNPRQQLIDRTAEITSTLKQVALAEGVAIVLLAQITREGRKAARGANGENGIDPVPRVEDLYGGSAIESDADAVVFLHPLAKEGDDRRVNAIIAKNRRGPSPLTLPLWLFGQWQFFQDIEQEVEPCAKDRAARMTAQPSDSEAVFG